MKPTHADLTSMQYMSVYVFRNHHQTAGRDDVRGAARLPMTPSSFNPLLIRGRSAIRRDLNLMPSCSMERMALKKKKGLLMRKRENIHSDGARKCPLSETEGERCSLAFTHAFLTYDRMTRTGHGA